MDDDLGEFCQRVGKDIPMYRLCYLCEDIIIVNSDDYKKPKVLCDPTGVCSYYIPFCICQDEVIYNEKALEKCTYPECPCEIIAQDPPDLDEDFDE